MPCTISLGLALQSASELGDQRPRGAMPCDIGYLAQFALAKLRNTYKHQHRTYRSRSTTSISALQVPVVVLVEVLVVVLVLTIGLVQVVV